MSREFKITTLDGMPEPMPLIEIVEFDDFLQRTRERNLRYAEWRRKREALARRPSARLIRFLRRWVALFRWGIGDSIVAFGKWVRE